MSNTITNSQTLAPRTLFLLGITQRSGTNFLLRLLLKNPALQFPFPSGEDFLVYHLRDLVKFRNGVINSWGRDWKDFDIEGLSNRLDEQLRGALYQFLWNDRNPDYLVTKTPFFKGLPEAGGFLPESKYILLVRDGRNAVESMVQGFGRDYKTAMETWAENAQAYFDFVQQHPEVNHALVKYEDLTSDPAGTLQNLFATLQIPDAGCDYASMEELEVLGSSYSDQRPGKIDWQNKLQKAEAGDVNARYAHWGRSVKKKYNRICGPWAERLGYEIF